jgi:hypothetical protein
MADNESRKQRGERHEAEIEESQRALRDSISRTERLLNESDEMLKRHRREREEDET